MTLATLRTSVRTRLGVPTTDAFYTDTILTALINDALHQIESEDDWRWLEEEGSVSVTSGTATYNLPTRYRSTISLTNADGFPIKRATAEERQLLAGASGAAKVYDIYGDQLRLAPNPNGNTTLTHLYIGGEPDLSADGDSPVLPAVWHPAIVEYAAYLAWRRWGPQADAGSALAAYEGWIEKMRPHARGYSPSTGGGETPQPVVEAKR